MVHDDLLLDGLVQGQAEVLHLVGRGSTNLHHIGYSFYNSEFNKNKNSGPPLHFNAIYGVLRIRIRVNPELFPLSGIINVRPVICGLCVLSPVGLSYEIDNGR